MVKRFAGDPLAFARREAVAKRNLQIAQRDLASMPVEDRHQAAEAKRQAITSFARNHRNESRGEEQAQPFQPMPDCFPNGAHPVFIHRDLPRWNAISEGVARIVATKSPEI